MNANLEQAIMTQGRAIFSQISNEKESLFDKQYWLGKLMDWVMRDQSFKVDLFRFVDVLPMLKTTEQVSSHIKEYLQKDERDIPIFMNTALKAATFSLTQNLAAKTIKKNVSEMAKKFIAGQDINEAKPTLKELSSQGFCFTIDLLGEKTLSDAEADLFQERYLNLIRDLPVILQALSPNNDIKRPNVSVKISALSCRLYETDVMYSVNDLEKRVLPLLKEAKDKGVFINFDVENFQNHEICFELFKKIALSPEFKSWPHLGIVVQAYLKKSSILTQEMIELAKQRNTPITIRLVKGAYWDYETIKAEQYGHDIPVYQDKETTDANYEALSKLLLDNHVLTTPAFASHNIRSLAHALAYANSRNIDKKSYEIQMLYGMAEAERRVFCKQGYLVRLYMPLGDMLPGMSYLVRRLLENTSQMGFLRLTHHEHHDVDSLLKAPQFVDSTRENSPGFRNTSLADFTNSVVRDQFSRAIKSIKDTFPVKIPIVINGEKIASEKTTSIVCPSDNNLLITHLNLATVQHAEKAVLACHDIKDVFAKTSLKDRAQHLMNLAQSLESDRFSLAALICFEVGKTWAEADADVAEAIDFCRYYAERALAELSLVSMNVAGETNTLSYQGRGPSVIIAPWNFPLAILCGMSCAAYVAGNPLIMKPAEQSSAIAYALYQHMEKSSFIKNAFHFLPGYGEEIGPYLVKHPLISNICFTGSKAVGHEIMQSANTVHPEQLSMKRVICEMGGKNAIIVDDDADLDEAVAAIINSAFIYAGQKCSAASRVIVMTTIKDTLIERLVEAIKGITIDASFFPKTFMGPVIDQDSYRRLKKIQADLKNDAHIKILYTKDINSNGYFVAPLIVETENAHHWVMQEELFGPILAVISARDCTHAIAIANNTKYALTASFFSRSPNNIAYAKEHFLVGNLYINHKCTGAMVYRQPFGGFKMSGVGFKAGGPNYLLQLVDQKVISENTMRRGFAPEISV